MLRQGFDRLAVTWIGIGIGEPDDDAGKVRILPPARGQHGGDMGLPVLIT